MTEYTTRDGLNATEAGRDRLRFLVAEAHRPDYESRGGVIRPKTAKRRERESAVANAVVRFAFDHGPYRGSRMSPDGLYQDLLLEAKALGELQRPSRD